MLSSTFSSKFDFVARVALAGTLIILAYNGLVVLLRPDAVLYYDAESRNRAIGERYVDNASARSVMVGSSLTYVISTEAMGGDYLGPNIYNLGLSGRNAATGIDIILRKPQKPHRVFVEINLMNAESEQFAQGLFAEPWLSVRTIAPAFRAQYRPIDLMIAYTRNAIRSVRHSELIDQTYTPDPARPPLPPIFTDVGLAEAVANLNRLVLLVDELRALGIDVILVMFPFDESVERTPRALKLREMVHDRFPPETYDWLAISQSSIYRTSDGIHLNVSSARRMAVLLRQTDAARDVAGRR